MEENVVPLRKDKTEKEWQTEAIDWLKKDPRVGDVWRNDGRRQSSRRFGTVGSHRPRGLSDLIGYTTDGRIFAIELKTLKGRSTEDQERFLGRVQAFKGRSGIARTTSDLEAVLSQP